MAESTVRGNRRFTQVLGAVLKPAACPPWFLVLSHKLGREQFGQIGQFPWAVRVFQGRASHTSQASWIGVAIGRENPFGPQLVPPDGSMGIVKTVVIEELLLELQLQLSETEISGRQRGDCGCGRGAENAAAKDESMGISIRPAEQGLNSLMQLAQGRIAAYQNASPKVRACAA